MSEKKTPNEKFFGRPISRKKVLEDLGDPSTWDADEARLLAQYYRAPVPLDTQNLAIDAPIRLADKRKQLTPLARQRVGSTLSHAAIAASGKGASAGKAVSKRPAKHATASKKEPTTATIRTTKPLMKVAATLTVADKRKRNAKAPKDKRVQKKRSRRSTGSR